MFSRVDTETLLDAHQCVVVVPHGDGAVVDQPVGADQAQPPDLRADQCVPQEHRRSGQDPDDQEHRGAGALRGQPDRTLSACQATLRTGCLRALRPLHRPMPGRHRGPAACRRCTSFKTSSARDRRRASARSRTWRAGLPMEEGLDGAPAMVGERDPRRVALGLSHLRRLSWTACPVFIEHVPHDRRYAPQPGDGRGAHAGDGAGHAGDTGATGAPLAWHAVHARVVDGGAGRAGLDRRGGISLLRGLHGDDGRSRNGDLKVGGEAPAAGWAFRSGCWAGLESCNGDPARPLRQRVPLSDSGRTADLDVR